MNEFSKEVIEIDGIEYTLFLNRAGLVAIEKYTKNDLSNIQKLQEVTSDISNNKQEITENTDPFEGLENIDEILNNADNVKKEIYKKMFWIMLRTNHKLTPSECFALYDKAYDIYGEQVDKLIDQIVGDINIDKTTKQEENKQVKNLKALRPTK